MGQVKKQLYKILVRRIGDSTHEVQTGDTLVLPNGKTFFVTGWDAFSGLISGQTCCSQHYFVSVYPAQCGCSWVEA